MDSLPTIRKACDKRMVDDNRTISFSLTVPFPSERGAEIVLNTLKVDCELKRGGVKKSLSRVKNSLKVEFSAYETRSLRVSVNSFFDHLNLVINTLEEFGPP